MIRTWRNKEGGRVGGRVGRERAGGIEEGRGWCGRKSGMLLSTVQLSTSEMAGTAAGVNRTWSAHREKLGKEVANDGKL